MRTHCLLHGKIHVATAEEVYPSLSGVRLIISDGPYGMSKADWDKVKDLAAWYRPHIEAWSPRVLRSSSLYFWNTPIGWAQVHPLILAEGWTLRNLIVWDKGLASLSGKGIANLRMWPNVIEVCGFYQRDVFGVDASIAHVAGGDDGNWIREWMRSEWNACGLPRKMADEAVGSKGGMAGHYFGRSQWELPPRGQFLRLAAVAQSQGPPRTRPYFVLPEQPDAGHTYDVLESAVEEIRASYEIQRVPFHPAMGTTDCWSHPKVSGLERLRNADGKPLHPCQKPLLFSRRMIEASTRSGDLVFEPFGGTCRAAFACEELGDRRYVCSEMNPEYVDAVVPLLPKEQSFEGKQRLLFRCG